MKLRTIPLATLAAFTLAGPASAATLLFSDNFNDNPNDQTSTFNDNLASTQAGSIGVTTYSLLGDGNANQHSNSSELLVATFNGNNTGRVSLDNDFATQANAADLANPGDGILVFQFTLKNVSGFTAADNWGAFTVGATQNPFVNAGGGASILFRQNGVTQAFNAGTPVADTATWSVDDIVTITLSGTGGIGSAFNGGGSVVNFKIGSTDVGTFTLAQQAAAYLTFGIAAAATGHDFNAAVFKIDDLSVTAIPEPGAALLGLLSLLALLRRRRA